MFAKDLLHFRRCAPAWWHNVAASLEKVRIAQLHTDAQGKLVHVISPTLPRELCRYGGNVVSIAPDYSPTLEVSRPPEGDSTDAETVWMSSQIMFRS
jgi:hypothetical protein